MKRHIPHKKEKSTRYNGQQQATPVVATVLTLKATQHSDGIERYWLGPYQLTPAMYKLAIEAPSMVELQSSCRGS